ncbi:MAG: bifunctional isocitrate dehydrogenase kinase/phosphatase [Thiotrichales bacterium]|nr:bifunctional isocitrate dehydrogenase kinase/phosphatase [Thiotrichales bacterium]
MSGNRPTTANAADSAPPSDRSPDYADRIATARSIDERTDLAARWILAEFDVYYAESRNIPNLARAAFEGLDPASSLHLSLRRLSLYSVSARALARRLRDTLPPTAEGESFWERIRARYLTLIEGRYESDLAFAYIHTARRMMYEGMWKPVEYTFLDHREPASERSAAVRLDFPVGPAADLAALVDRILDVPGFERPWRDRAGDVRRVAERLRSIFDADKRRPVELQMTDAGFFRNRGAYIVGRIVFDAASATPLILALLNHEAGIYVQAVLAGEADAHNLFSSTLANFHATNSHYHELAAFLHSVMPTRRLGLHYSTIGFNHVGKVAVMNELREELVERGEVFTTAIGFRGSVAMGFAAPSSDYNLKVIRDTPTDEYKWGAFPGIAAVLDKYRRVHEIDRTGSMLDNIIYHNLELDRAWFEPELLAELLRDAAESVSLHDDAVILKHLIVQRRVRPLPVFLRDATPEEAREVIVNLGHCIKNNAAANVFNRDLDARNYGVSRFYKVYLFDYDALEPLTRIKIRSNADRFDGEDGVPDWFYEDGVIFLPEEIESGFRIHDRAIRRLFRDVHGDLLTTGYWEGMQSDLERGRVPSIRLYPEERKLDHPGWPSAPAGE